MPQWVDTSDLWIDIMCLILPVVAVAQVEGISSSLLVEPLDRFVGNLRYE